MYNEEKQLLTDGYIRRLLSKTNSVIYALGGVMLFIYIAVFITLRTLSSRYDWHFAITVGALVGLTVIFGIVLVPIIISIVNDLRKKNTDVTFRYYEDTLERINDREEVITAYHNRKMRKVAFYFKYFGRFEPQNREHVYSIVGDKFYIVTHDNDNMVPLFIFPKKIYDCKNITPIPKPTLNDEEKTENF